MRRVAEPVLILAFRLSGIAGRNDQAPVLVSAEAAEAAPGAADYGPLQELGIKGREGTARVVSAAGLQDDESG